MALEGLRQTIQQEQLTANAMSQAVQGPNNQSVRAEPVSPANPSAEGSRGTILDILA